MTGQEKQKQVLMLAYTLYSIDARIMREAETLVSHGYQVKILVPREPGTPQEYVSGGVEVSGLNIHKYQGNSNARYLASYLMFTFMASMKINWLFLKRKIDIIHVHNMPNFLVCAALLPRLFGVKLILDIHDTMPETYATKFRDHKKILARILCWEEALCCKLSSRLICVNHPQKDVLVERGIPADKIEILMNVPDHRRFKPSLKDESDGGSPGSFNLVYHGTQARRLGVDFTIRAVAKLKDQIPGLEFHNIGGGDELENLMRLSKELGTEDRIFFSRENIHIDALPEILGRMDVGIIANRKNQATALMLPVKMLEYIAMDIPVIVPRLRTIQYYFDDGMVSYFEPENVDSLAEAILNLYENPLKREAQAREARKFIDRYGWENHQLDLVNLYRNLLGEL